MTKLTKAFKEEWSFFLNEKGRFSYNEYCKRCERDCKQSYCVELICCPLYLSKRRRNKKTAVEENIDSEI